MANSESHNFARTIEASCENSDCEEPQTMSFTPSEFEDWLNDGEYRCTRCGVELSISGLAITCALCSAEIDYLDLDHLLNDILCDRCPECAGRWDVTGIHSVFIEGSWSESYFIYDWTRRGKSIGALERAGRTDYWEGLVHFCTAEEFISIYNDRRINASSTGLYGKRSPSQTKAVCLTETTEPNWGELKAAHGDYGFVFQKRDIIRLRGAPSIYLLQLVIDQMKTDGETIPSTLWPYLTKLKLRSPSSSDTKHDFLHEREWRVPQDIDFKVARPFAVTFPKQRPGIEGDELILQAAREFQELSRNGEITSDEDENQDADE